MPEYLYECKTHGTVSVRKPMAEAGRVEYCPEARWLGLGPCGLPLRRIYHTQKLIVRSPFWNLSPEDPRYSSRLTFAREQELGAMKTITSASQDRTIMREVEAEDWPDPTDSILSKFDERGMQEISELCQAVADDIDD